MSPSRADRHTHHKAQLLSLSRSIAVRQKARLLGKRGRSANGV